MQMTDSQPPDSQDVNRQIAELEAALKQDLPGAARHATEALLTMLRAKVAANTPSAGAPLIGDRLRAGDINDSTVAIGAGASAIGSQGTVHLGDDARINGVVVGVNLGNIVFGRDIEESERRRLVWYLSRLASKLYRLPLRGIEERLDQGEGMALPQVFVTQATTNYVEVTRGRPETVKHYFERDDPSQPLKHTYHPDWALPYHAIVNTNSDLEATPAKILSRDLLVLTRAMLATESVAQHRHLVLLGAPGSGKSAFLRHLAWVLACRGLDQPVDPHALMGWDNKSLVLPIILPLRSLAGWLAQAGSEAWETVVLGALRHEMEQYNVVDVDDMLSAALHSGTALVLLDGLDEVPLEAVARVSADRRSTLEAVRAFADLHVKTRIVLTCRTRAFTDDLHTWLGWPVETIAPFTLGQMRHFVVAWYGELAAKHKLDAGAQTQLTHNLTDTIISSPKLRVMAETPLLLTLMALVLFNEGALPRDRPLLYERVLKLLLGQWDEVRDGLSLAKAIGLPDWGSERLLPLLDWLSYEAHLADSSLDGRGRIDRSRVRNALIDFFETVRVSEPWATAWRCLDYFEQRSGLLAPDGAESYVFAHLTLQEHCAGRHIALGSENPLELVLKHRIDDRWREPILLGMGLAHPAVLNSVLDELISGEECDTPKTRVRWYRDLLLAADIGRDRDWNYLRTRPMIKVDRLLRALRFGLISLLGDREQPLDVADRIQMGLLLGELGDPRYAVTIDQWQAELKTALAGNTGSYFCRVEAGEYIIGSSDNDLTVDDNEKPQHIFRLEVPMLIGRYPITNAQWQVWVANGGKPSYFHEDANLNAPNKPVVGVTWHACNDFCAWLTEQLQDVLPQGHIVRLPSEQEWEAAARGGDSRRYAWGHEWQEDRAAVEDDQEQRGWDWTVPVGCYPAGVAACGALDIIGNIWEWTASPWRSYWDARNKFANDKRRVLRGGSFRDNKARVGCSSRFRLLPNYDIFNNAEGFRIVVTSKLASEE